MISIRRDTLAYEMLTFLAYVGEFPYSSLHLLGNSEVYRKLISKLSQEQTFRIPNHPDRITGRALNISGSKSLKTIRLSQKGVAILEIANPEAAEYHLQTYGRTNPSSSSVRIDRSHRLAETTALFRLVGIETRPYELPTLQLTNFKNIIPAEPVFYTSHTLKHFGQDSVNKIAFSRITGMLFSPGGSYVVYNSRDSLMNWNGRGEGKVKLHLSSVARMNAGIDEVNSAMMLGSDYHIAKQTLAFLGKVNRVEMRFDNIYSHLHFVPMNSFGVRLIKLLVIPDWNEILQDLLFDEEELAGTGATFCYDAFREGTYMLSFLDSDIFRLNAFWEAVRVHKYKASVICFPEQVPFLRSLLRDKVSIQTVTMDMVENAIYEGCDSNE